MDVAVGVEEDIVGFYVAVDDILVVDVLQGAAELGYPEANGVLGKSLAGNVKAQVAAGH